MKNGKSLGLKIGTIFSIVSFLFTFTIAIPMFSVFPSLFLEEAISSILPNLPSDNSGIATILVLVIIFLIALLFTLKRVKKSAQENQKLKGSEIIIMMLIFYPIVHNLGYYIFLGINYFPVDALNVIYSAITFPLSSLSFILLGFLIDWYWKKTSSEKLY